MPAAHVTLLALAIAQPAPSHPTDQQGVLVRRAAWVMGTDLRLTLVAPDQGTGQRAAEAAINAIRQVDGELSTWREDTEMQRVNRAPVAAVIKLSPSLAMMLPEVWRWWRETGGTFDPGVGPLVEVWGVRGSLRTPAPAVLARALEQSGLRQFSLDSAGGTIVRRHGRAWIDTGGFGKGAALRSVDRVLRAAGIGAALVDFGGQGLAIGSAPDAVGSGGWTIGVAHPVQRMVPVRELLLRDRSVSTSGQSEQPGHILDPRSGRPAPAWGSVTVVAPDPMVADILSTALFVMGPEEGSRWAHDRADFGALFLILRQGGVEARWNAAMQPFLKEQP